MSKEGAPLQEEDPQGHEVGLSSEQLEAAEKTAREKLEFLFGEKPAEQFAIRFMSLQEYQSMMEGKRVGSGEANVFGGPIRYQSDLLVSSRLLKEVRKSMTQKHSTASAFNNIRDASVEYQKKLRHINEKSGSLPEFPPDNEQPAYDLREFQLTVKLSAAEQQEYFSMTFEKFLMNGVGDGWYRTIKGMTDWDMSAAAVGYYSGFGRIESKFSNILLEVSAKAKDVGFEEKVGEEKRVYFLKLLRDRILKDKTLMRYFGEAQHFINFKKRELDTLKTSNEKSAEIEELESFLNNPNIAYVDTIQELVDDENYLNIHGAIQKVFYALANMEDVKEGFRKDMWDMKKLQYQVAVAFRAKEAPKDAHWGREQWGYADTSKEGMLAVVALMPDAELEKKLETSSERNVENAFPVFNSYGSLKFPELIK